MNTRGIERTGNRDTSDTDIAVVGIACRFPGAHGVEEYWSLIADGRRGIRELTREQLRAGGAREVRIADPSLVPAGGVLWDADRFDASFFGYSAREAALMDPQQRMFLEEAWHALDDTGHTPDRFRGVIGVYAGQTLGTHRQKDLEMFLGTSGDLFTAADDKDFLPTRVSYKLGLTGPSIAVQTACSTSLVAIHLACRALMTHDCDMALAGGVSWTPLRRQGYLHQEGGVWSADGQVRSFDRDASGFVPADGLGIVALRRLDDALADGDRVYAVVKGSAVGNDGSDKLSYTAPGLTGQQAVVEAALAVSSVDPDTVAYVEAHGTATALGDAVEAAALTRAYRAAGATGRGYCRLGSAKSNIGHTDAAAGVAGFIKAALMVYHGRIPPSPALRSPNPEIDFETSPFRPAAAGEEWPDTGAPRRAAVSSFGIGGTNAHAVLEEPPPRPPSEPARPWQLVALSARDETALAEMAGSCADALENVSGAEFADLARTLVVGRRAFPVRYAGVFRDPSHAAADLRAHAARTPVPAAPRGNGDVVFLFPGEETRHPAMGRELYRDEPVFRAAVDECLRLLPERSFTGRLRALWTGGEQSAPDGERVEADSDPRLAGPAVFIMEIALARLLMSLGVRPSLLMGHGLGEYAAACVADVMSLREALSLVVRRGELSSSLPDGAMPGVSGAERGADPVLNEFRDFVGRIPLRGPSVPLVPNTTGAEDADVTDPEYWVSRLRTTARSGTGLDHLLSQGPRALVEVGPGATLTAPARDRADVDAVVVNTARGPAEERDDREVLLRALARLWEAGIALDLSALWPERRRRRPAVSYPFAPTVHLTKPTPGREPAAPDRSPEGLYGITWTRAVEVRPADTAPAANGYRWVLLSDSSPLAEAIAVRLERSGAAVTVATPGARFHRADSNGVTIDPRCGEHYERLLRGSGGGAGGPLRIIDLWGAALPPEVHPPLSDVVGLARALNGWPGEADLCLVTRGGVEITGGERLDPWAALTLGAAGPLREELADVRVRVVDLDRDDGGDPKARARDILDEFHRPPGEAPVGLRTGHRWLRRFEPLDAVCGTGPSPRRGGTYVITGGTSGIGLRLAEHLAREYAARLVLIGRDARGIPPADGSGGQGNPSMSALSSDRDDVLVRGADVADAPRLKAVLHEARSRFGAIHGVVHAAGVPGGGLAGLLTEGEIAAALRAKTEGTAALVAALRETGTRPDFVMLFSSLASFSGVPGLTCYSAANAFLDTFAANARRDSGMPVLSVNWDRWKGTGMAREADRRHRELTGAGLTGGLSPEEGIAAFEKCLGALSLGQVVVSARPPGAGGTPGTEAAATADRSRLLDPAPSTTPTAVGGEEWNSHEQELRELWQEVLGVRGIGRDDDFFSLGGDSLDALQIVQGCKDRLGARVSMETVFASPTIGALAKTLTETFAGGEARGPGEGGSTGTGEDSAP